jgi:DNA-binding transcriptional MerR regulator
MSQKIYFKIGEIAKRYNVNPSLIRYWEQEFDFIKPKKSAKGTRLFTRKDVDHFEIIYHLVKEKGMTIQGVRDYMAKRNQENTVDKLQVINTLKRTRSLLEEVKGIIDSKNNQPSV